MIDDYLAEGGEVDLDRAQHYFRKQRTRRIKGFWHSLLDRVAELYRYDVWAVGAILGGNLHTDFFRAYARWVIAHGRPFFDEVRHSPAHAATEADASAPAVRFDNHLHAADLVYSARGGLWQRDLPRVHDIARRGPPSGEPWQWQDLAQRHPELWQTCFIEPDRRPPLPAADAMAVMRDFDLCEYTARPLTSWVDFCSPPVYLVAQYATLTPELRSLHAAHWCDMEISNGGFDQFFRNSTGAVTREALDGFAMVNADPHQAYLAGYAEMFPGGMPARDWETRKRRLDGICTAAGVNVIDNIPLDGVGPVEREIDSFIAEFIRANTSSFFRPVTLDG